MYLINPQLMHCCTLSAAVLAMSYDNFMLALLCTPPVHASPLIQHYYICAYVWPAASLHLLELESHAWNELIFNLFLQKLLLMDDILVS